MTNDEPNAEQARAQVHTLIELLRTDYEVEWTPSKKLPNGAQTLPYPSYDGRVRAGLQAALELVGTDFNYPDHKDRRDPRRIEVASRDDLSTWVTFIMRGERFCDGHIGGYIENGLLLQILERIEAVTLQSPVD